MAAAKGKSTGGRKVRHDRADSLTSVRRRE